MLVAVGNTLFRWRNSIFPVVFLLLFLGVQPAATGALHLAMDIAGFLLVLAGTGTRLAVAGVHYIKRAGAANHINAGALYVDGLFGAVRNPLYVGNILLGAGFLALLGNPLAWIPGMLVVGLAYSAIVAAEEDYLSRTFGDVYARYCASVPRWTPRLGALQVACTGAGFSWRRAVAMEYSTLGAVALALILLDMRDRAATTHGVPAAHAWAILIVLAGTVSLRMAKKSGALR